MSLVTLLRRFGVLPLYSDDQVISAEAEYAIREHEQALERVRCQALTVEASNARLRETIRKSLSSSAFGDLEQDMQDGKGRRARVR